MPGIAETLPTARAAAVAVLEEAMPSLKVYDHSPLEFDRLPAIEMLLPEIRRTEPDESESELFRDDWHITWPLRLNVKLDQPGRAQDEAIALAGALIGAFDADPTLGNAVGLIDSKITASTGGFVRTDAEGAPLAQPRVTYDLALSFLLLVS